MINIDFATNKDKKEIANLIEVTFKFFDFLSLDFIIDSLREDDNSAELNNEYGFFLKMTLNGKIIGVHNLEPENLNKKNYSDFNYDFNEKIGLKGVLFGIHPNYQRNGYGTEFIKFEKNFFKGKFDYIHGGCFEKLKNVDFWIKNRDVVIPDSKDKYKTTGYTSIMFL